MGDASLDVSGPAATPPASTPPDPYADIASLDHTELIKRHPQLRDTVAGYEGRIKQHQGERERIRAEARAELETEQEERRLSDLRKSNPYQYVEELEAREQADQLSKSQQAQVHSVVGDFDGILRAQLGRLPDATRRELAARDYGSDLDARSKFLEAVMESYAEHKVTEAREAWKTQDREAFGTEVRGEAALRYQLDTGAGTPPGARVLTDEDIARMDLPEYEKYFDEHGEPRDGVIVRAAAAGARR
jgi:hypothetical protein